MRFTAQNVDLLIKHGAEITATTEDDISPLMLAAQNEDIAMFKKIAAMNFSFDDVDSKGSTLLHHAATGQHVELLKSALEHGLDLNAADSNGFTPLMDAAGNGTPECVKFLLAAGANVNASGGGGKSALYNAVQYGKLEVTEILLAAGADINLDRYMSETLLHTASTVNFFGTNFMRFIIDGTPTETVQHERNLAKSARSQGLIDIASKFEEPEFNLMEIATEFKVLETTPISLSKNVEDQPQLVRLLLKYGADVNAVDEAGCTALHYAVGGGILEVIKVLLQAGAKFDIKNQSGLTAVDLAVDFGLDLEDLPTTDSSASIESDTS